MDAKPTTTPAAAAPSAKLCPFTEAELIAVAETRQTPFHLLDEATIRAACRSMKDAFAWCSGFNNYYAVKCNPNPEVLKIMLSEGFGVDCSSGTELTLADVIGFRKEQIMFTSNNTHMRDFATVKGLGGVMNLDDISHVDYVKEKIGLPDLISFRYNPGAERSVGMNTFIGNPAEAKFGMTRPQLLEAFEQCRDAGVKRFGIHTMMVSNCLDIAELGKTAEIMFALAVEVKEKLGIAVEFVNLGGGIGVPYKVDEKAVDIEALGVLIKAEFDKTMVPAALESVKLFFECGRWIVAPAGVLVTRVQHHKNIHKKYIGVDACMAHLMRPGMYGAYHHITVARRNPSQPLLSALPSKTDIFEGDAEAPFTCDVVGGLCENNDKFAIDRTLPLRPRIGDVVAIHDAGGHGSAMGFNYNGQLRAAEYVKRLDGEVEQIRRAEELADYFRTVNCKGLPGQTDCCGGSGLLRQAALLAAAAVVGYAVAKRFAAKGH